jgi:cytochrome c biogenesis protein CcdA/thiol-disulfide isomerase/thioredoxin
MDAHLTIGLLTAMFTAGVLTILLPCILPLVPIVVGVSIAGRSKWRPFLAVLGMLVSFVGFTFLLYLALAQFVTLADVIRIATYYILLLFGIGFTFHDRRVQFLLAAVGAGFFSEFGYGPVLIAAIVGVIAMMVGGVVAAKLQTLGTVIQEGARKEFGDAHPITAFIIGLTLGLVWVPCAGPALGFALTLVREQPGFIALVYLCTYGIGTALPLLLIGYGGQAIAQSARNFNRFTGYVKAGAGILLIASALALRFDLFLRFETWLTSSTGFGTLGTRLEERLFHDSRSPDTMPVDSSSSMTLPPSSVVAPEFSGIERWLNSDPLTMKELRGKVVLVDFWTYSCINCIRTLPYIKQYYEKYAVRNPDGSIDIARTPFVLIGVHTPEFVFEKSEKNVKDALALHALAYPVALDNDYGTWKAFANHYWPAKYLIDADGKIRYHHFGEGSYDETDEAIASLLKEAGLNGPVTSIDVASKDEAAPGMPRTPETYLGSRNWPSFGNAKGDPTTQAVTYAAPATTELNRYYLAGTWRLSDDEERQILESDEGEIRLRFQGAEANLVLGLEPGVASVKADVFIDGQRTQTVTIDRNDLFNLFKGDYGEHELILKIHGKGVAGYAFTFG